MSKRSYIKLILIAILTSITCGIIGSLFSLAVSFATEIRTNYSSTLYFLPLGGLLSVFLYKKLKVNGVSTSHVFQSILSEKNVSPKLAPAVFGASVLTHLFGGSAGREGAALQLGGGVSSFFSRTFKLTDLERRILTLCGMAAFFSSVFGTPIGACIFVLEVVFSGSVCFIAILPTIVSSLVAFIVAQIIGIKPERFGLGNIPNLKFSIILKICAITILSAFVSILFCYALKYSKELFKKIFASEYIRIFIGGSFVVIITLIIGSRDYNGAGVNIIEHIFENGTVRYEAFVLKILLTVITVAAGYKGGEIIPTLFIGATFGAAVALLLGLAPAIGAAVGMTALFCGVTNCPITAVVLSAEMFGIKGIFFFMISSLLSYVFSAKITLYDINIKKFLK